MRLNRFDLNLLLVLDALLEERNVTRASERLHIGQSAASSALARLREYFEDELLVPVGRQFELTPLARTLIEPVRETLLRARDTISRRPGFDPASAERRFTVYASDYVTTVMLAGAMMRIAAEAPGISLDIRSPPKNLGEIFERGNIDLLIIPQQYAQRLELPYVSLFEDTQVCVAWSGNTQLGSSISFDEYMASGHVAVRFGDDRSITFEEWFMPRYRKPRRIDVSVDNFTTVPLLVVGTQRIATVHRRLAVHFAAQLPLRLIEAPFDMPSLVETMLWPRHLEHDPAHAWLRQRLAEFAQTIGSANP